MTRSNPKPPHRYEDATLTPAHQPASDGVERKLVVAGASGLIGRAALERFAALPDWEVVGVSRRLPDAVTGAQLVPLDLLDSAACQAFAAGHRGITHLIYAAVFERPGLVAGWLDEEAIALNMAMLSNLFEAIESSDLRQVTLMHGTKAYGVHAGIPVTPSMIPLRERTPRAEHRNFYFEQEDYLQRRRSGWDLTIFRPTVVYGGATGTNMNPLLALLVYALLLRESGEPLHRPWQPGTEPGLVEAVDADLIAQACAWAATSESAANETFNLTNGDLFTWEGMWPVFADALGMAVGEYRPTSFYTDIRPQNAAWSAIVERYQLAAPRDLDAYVGANSFAYADIVITAAAARRPLPLLNSTIKVRRAGFGACLDTEDMFRSQIRALQGQRLIPR
jgi:nucleoside-diphosphate-sugar epimerase